MKDMISSASKRSKGWRLALPFISLHASVMRFTEVAVHLDVQPIVLIS
jgi:hypothetical protein